MVKDTIEYYTNIDLHDSQIRNVAVDVVESKPTTGGKAGQIKSWEGYLYMSDGKNYRELGLASDIGTVATRVTDLETTVGKTDSEGLRGLVAQNGTNISGLTSKVSKLEGEMDAAEGRLDTTESDIDTLEGTVQTHGTDIENLKSLVGSTEDGSNLIDKVSGIETNLNNNYYTKTQVYTKDETDAKVKVATDAAATNLGKIEALENAGYITNAVNDLVNYYTKTETYTKSEVSELIDAVKTFSVKVVDSLPATGDDKTIYFVSNSGAGQNVKDEYIYIGGQWELLGTTQFQLNITQTAAGITINDKTLQTASASQTGLLSAADWTTFNAKQNAGDYATSSKLTEELAKKQDTVTGAATSIVTNNLDASKVLISDATGKVAAGSATATEVGYLSGVTSAIQTQINGKVAKNADITAATNFFGKISYDAKGLVTGSAAITGDDLPTGIPVAKLSGLDSAVRTAVRYKEDIATAGTSVSVNHKLNVDYPHVTIYKNNSIVYAAVTYVDENNVLIESTSDLGAITVIVSA